MKDDELRIYEIKWYNMINVFFKHSPNPAKLYDYIEMLGYIFDCNQLILRRATVLVVQDNYNIRPRRAELAILLVNQGSSIRKACRELNISPTTYYNNRDKVTKGEVSIAPRYPIELMDDIIKCMDGMKNLLNIINID